MDKGLKTFVKLYFNLKDIGLDLITDSQRNQIDIFFG